MTAATAIDLSDETTQESETDFEAWRTQKSCRQTPVERLFEFLPPEDGETNNALAEEWQTASEDRKQQIEAILVYANFRLGYKYVRLRSYEGGDYGSAGENVGLIFFALLKTLEHFDRNKPGGACFTTYFGYWLRSCKGRAKRDERTDLPMRVPVHVQDALAQIRRMQSRFYARTGREPNMQELLAEAADCNLSLTRTAPATIAKHLKKYPGQSDSTDRIPNPRGDVIDGNVPLLDYVANAPASQEATSLARDLLPRLLQVEEVLHACLRHLLHERDYQTFLLRYVRGYTLEVAGICAGLTRERVRQLETAWFERLQIHLKIGAEEIDAIYMALDTCEELTGETPIRRRPPDVTHTQTGTQRPVPIDETIEHILEEGRYVLEQPRQPDIDHKRLIHSRERILAFLAKPDAAEVVHPHPPVPIRLAYATLWHCREAFGKSLRKHGFAYLGDPVALLAERFGIEPIFAMLLIHDLTDAGLIRIVTRLIGRQYGCVLMGGDPLDLLDEHDLAYTARRRAPFEFDITRYMPSTPVLTEAWL